LLLGSALAARYRTSGHDFIFTEQRLVCRFCDSTGSNPLNLDVWRSHIIILLLLQELELLVHLSLLFVLEQELVHFLVIRALVA